jgi:peptidyl-prolyl cis-trans isomerase D
MISFFRRALSSWIVLGLLGLIMIAFIVTGVGTPGGLGNISGASGDTVATIGKERLTSTEVTQRAQIALQGVQQEQQGITMAAFVQQGGVDSLVQQLIDAKAIEHWANEQGIAASKRLVDGDIASIPAFHGLSGKFDETTYRNLLAERRITEAQFRRDLTGDAIRRQILVPISASARAPLSLVTPYASLMLEARKGQIGIVPTELRPPGNVPTEADLNAWYSAHLAQYTMPERRVLRYALISKAQLKQQPQVSDAEIANFYKANAAEYGATETRSFSQVVLPDEAAAKAFAAKVKAGTSFAAAAQGAGFTPADTALGTRTEAALSELASADVAKAAFAALQGGTTEPLKSPLGWHVVHVDGVKSAAAKPLASVRETIATSIQKQKTDEAIVDLIAQIEDEIADGSTFDEVAKARALKIVSTPAILPNGAAPESNGWTAPAELQVLLKPAFESSSDDDPTVENIGNGELHALLKVDHVVPSAPIPLAKVKDRVTNDLMVDRASVRAQAVAKSILAKVNGGVPFARAIAEADIRLPPPQPAGGRQIDLLQSGRPVPPPLALMFGMKSGEAKLLEAPDKKGWFLVHLDSIEKGNVASMPGLAQSTQSEFSRMMAEEFQQQFSAAISQSVGVTRNAAALAKLKRELAGAASQ